MSGEEMLDKAEYFWSARVEGLSIWDIGHKLCQEL